MSKTSRSSPQIAVAASAAITERASATNSEGGINLRIEAKTRQLIDDAAAVLGETGAEFIIECARRQAMDVLLDERRFVINSDGYDQFLNELDKLPAPGPRLRSLPCRPPTAQAVCEEQ